VTERRLALVIGNAGYGGSNSLCQENNCPPINDAKAISAALERLDFEVITLYNRTKKEMEDAVDDFARRLKDYHTALFYFAGHGSEVGGKNYIYPIDASINREADIKYRCVEVNWILESIYEAGVINKIMLLDACRSNEFERTFRRGGETGGLSAMEAPVNTFIGYAAASGQTAANFSLSRKNGVYTEAILRYLETPNMTIGQVFTRVTKDVRLATEEEEETQIPFRTSSFEEDFFFRKLKADRDQDGYADEEDDCPDIFSKINRGCPMTDYDLDGIPDNQDPCPKRYGSNKGCPDLPGMVFVEGGRFAMGCTNEQKNCQSDEKPAHPVSVSDFYMGVYEVTFTEFDAFCEATNRKKPSDRDWGRGNRPVIRVSWYDAIEYCNWRSRRAGLEACYTIDKTRKDPNSKNFNDDYTWVVSCDFKKNGYRLPTEAEWEYAAREGGKSVLFGNGKNVPNLAEINFGLRWRPKADSVKGGDRKRTVTVGSFSPNSLGLYDMSGNVWEWCWDWYGPYGSEFRTNPTGVTSGSDRVIRGGSWEYPWNNLRVADRDPFDPNSKWSDVGFRLVRTAMDF